MLTIYSLANFIATVVMLSFAFIIYFGDRSEELKAYSFYSFFTGLWALSVGVTLFVLETNAELVMYGLRLSYWAGLCAGISFYYFERLHRESAQSHRVLKWVLFVLYAALFYGYLFTDAIVVGVEFGSHIFERIPLYNWIGFALFNFVFTVFSASAFWGLFKKWRAQIDILEAQKTLHIFVCGLFAFVPPVILSVALPLVDNFRFYWIAPFISMLWVIAMIYGIIKRKVFRPRVITAELLFVMLLVILFVNIFVPGDTIDRSAQYPYKEMSLSLLR